MTAIYARVDGRKDIENTPIGDQIREGMRYAKLNNKRMRIYKDYDSGFKLLRPGLERLISDIEKGQIDSLWIADLSRLSLVVTELVEIRKFLLSHKVALRCGRHNGLHFGHSSSNADDSQRLQIEIEMGWKKAWNRNISNRASHR